MKFDVLGGHTLIIIMIIVILSGQVFVSSLTGFGSGWGPRNPFAERIEKPVRNIGPPLIFISMKYFA